MYGQLAVEAVVVGITVVIFWLVANFIAGALNLPVTSNITIGSVAVLFSTGVIAHLFFEVTGLNKWYCKNSFACQR